jgi:hypothetical protein
MPITIYKDGGERRIFPVDLAGWLSHGWTLEPVPPAPVAPEVVEPDPVDPDPDPARSEVPQVRSNKSCIIRR